MPGRWSKDFNFVTAAYNGKHLVVALTPVEVEEEMQDLTILASWQDPQWSFIDNAFLWSAVDSTSITTPNSEAVFLGMGGEVLFTDGQIVREEMITFSSEAGPADRGPMCGIGIIENNLFAVGMGRQVYKRELMGQWLCLDHSIRPTEPVDKIVGFNSIHGFSLNEVYTVGFNGEIWWQDKGQWIQIDSPTNMPLCKVFCDGKDRVYACGRNGMLLTGRKDKWSILAEDETDDDLWSIARYHNKLYVIGTHDLYLLENGILIPVQIFGKSVGFGQCLIIDKDWLYFLGPKDLLVYNGHHWKRVN